MYTRVVVDDEAHCMNVMQGMEVAWENKDESYLVKVLEEGRRSRQLRVQDSSGTAYALLLATNSLLPYSLSPAELGERKLLEQEVTQVANLLLNGLQARTKKRKLRRV